jgi:hypothetical protein
MNKLKMLGKAFYAMLCLSMFNILLIMVFDVILNKGYIETFLIQRNPIATVIGFLMLTATEIIVMEI